MLNKYFEILEEFLKKDALGYAVAKVVFGFVLIGIALLVLDLFKDHGLLVIFFIYYVGYGLFSCVLKNMYRWEYYCRLSYSVSVSIICVVSILLPIILRFYG